MSKTKNNKSRKVSAPRAGRTKKIVATILALIITVGLAASITCNVLFYQKLLDIQGSIEQDMTQQPPLDDNNVVVNPGDVNGVELLSIDHDVAVLAANKTVNVPVTVTPDVDVAVSIDWTIKFKDASSAWANGKNVTDYVTVTPTSEGATTANVKVLKAFGEQIIVTAALSDNNAVNVSCTVDYVKKLMFTGLSVQEVKGVQSFVPTFSESVGTMSDPNLSVTVSITDEHEFIRQYEADRPLEILSANGDSEWLAALEAHFGRFEKTVTTDVGEAISLPYFDTLQWNNEYGVLVGGYVGKGQTDAEILKHNAFLIGLHPIEADYYGDQRYINQWYDHVGDICGAKWTDSTIKQSVLVLYDAVTSFPDLLVAQNAAALYPAFGYILQAPFMRLVITLSGDYNSDTIGTHILYGYNKVVSASSLDIDPPSIIV